MKLRKLSAILLAAVMVITVFPASVFGSQIINTNRPEGDWDYGRFQFDVKSDLPDDFASVTGIIVYIGHPDGNHAISDSFNGTIVANGQAQSMEDRTETTFGGPRFCLTDHGGGPACDENNLNNVCSPPDLRIWNRDVIHWQTNSPLFEANDNWAQIYLQAWWPQPAFSVVAWQYLVAGDTAVGDLFTTGRRIDINPFDGNFDISISAQYDSAPWWKPLFQRNDISAGKTYINGGEIDLSTDWDYGSGTNGSGTGITGTETVVNFGVRPFNNIRNLNLGDYIDISYTLSIGSFWTSGNYRAVYGSTLDRAMIDISSIATASSLQEFTTFEITHINGTPVFYDHCNVDLGAPDQLADSWFVYVSNGMDDINNGISVNSFTQARGMEIQTSSLSIPALDGEGNPTQIAIIWQSPHSLVWNSNYSRWDWGWNQKMIPLDEVYNSGVITLNFEDHLENYSEFVKANEEVKIFIANWNDGGRAAFGTITGAELFGCTCHDGVKINVSEQNGFRLNNDKNQLMFSVSGIDGYINDLTMEDFRGARGLAIEFENPELLHPHNEFHIIYQGAPDWSWNQIPIPVSSIMCEDDVIRIDFEKYLFRYDDFLSRTDVKMFLASYSNSYNFETLDIVDAYLYDFIQAAPHYDFSVPMGERNDFGGAADRQWFWASSGTDGFSQDILENGTTQQRLAAWQFKAAQGVAFYFDNVPDLDATFHLIWQGDGGVNNWGWHQFEVPLREVYNRTENAVFIDLERWINNYAGFSGSNFIKLGIAYWGGQDLFELGVTDAFLYGQNTIYNEYTRYLRIGNGTYNGAQLFEGNYNPYGIDFSKVAKVEFEFHITNIEQLRAMKAADNSFEPDMSVVLNIGNGTPGNYDSVWQQNRYVIDLSANTWKYSMTPGERPEGQTNLVIGGNNAGLAWFQPGVAAWGSREFTASAVEGYYHIRLLDKDNKEIPLIRQAQVVFAADELNVWAGHHEGNEIRTNRWMYFRNKATQDSKVRSMLFTGATVTGTEESLEYTVKVEGFGGDAASSGKWWYLAVNVGDSINLNEYFLTSISIEVDGVEVPQSDIQWQEEARAHFAVDYREIVLINGWWHGIEDMNIPFPKNSIEISFSLQRFVDVPSFVGFDIVYNLNGGTNPITAPHIYNPVTGIVGLPYPTREGHIFGGWYTVETYGGVLAPVSKISTTAGQVGTLTVFAKWIEDNKDETRYTVSSANADAAGVFTIDIAIENNPGIALLRNSIIFDNTAFELIGHEFHAARFPGNSMRAGVSSSPNNILWDSAADRNANGAFVTLSFRVRSNAPTGSYVIAVNPGNALNANIEIQDFAGGAGRINVTNKGNAHRPGDINNDGEVGMLDLLLLRLHILGTITLEGNALAAASLSNNINLTPEQNMDASLLMLRQYIVGDRTLS
jgi:uncharacterized repeat protein (TIGR02543 family)